MPMTSFVTSLDWRKSSYSSNQGGECVEVALSWHKSSYSGGQGGDCVEVALGWEKSSYSDSGGGNCVEIAAGVCHTNLRDSKNPEDGYFSFATPEWGTFLSTVKGGAR